MRHVFASLGQSTIILCILTPVSPELNYVSLNAFSVAFGGLNSLSCF